LDAAEPGWARLIGRPVAIDESDGCILGQIYGDYGDGLAARNLTREDAINCGFLWRCPVIDDGQDYSERACCPPPGQVAALNAAWQAEIASRTGGAA